MAAAVVATVAVAAAVGSLEAAAGMIPTTLAAAAAAKGQIESRLSSVAMIQTSAENRCCGRPWTATQVSACLLRSGNWHGAPPPQSLQRLPAPHHRRPMQGLVIGWRRGARPTHPQRPAQNPRHAGAVQHARGLRASAGARAEPTGQRGCRCLEARRIARSWAWQRWWSPSGSHGLQSMAEVRAQAMGSGPENWKRERVRHLVPLVVPLANHSVAQMKMAPERGHSPDRHS